MVRKHLPKPSSIPEPTLVRLTIYARSLRDALGDGQTVISSDDLAMRAGVNAAKVRKDLSHMGSFGRRGVGYDAALLLETIVQAMGQTKERSYVIVGAGKLGSALLGYNGFHGKGFMAVGAFDTDPSKIGRSIGGITVMPVDELERFVMAEGVDIGIVTVPAPAAQKITDTLVRGGVKAILNFAPTVVVVPGCILCRHVELSSELEVLAHYLNSQGD
jgi:redox-sensing transcriptional repressor